MAESKAREREPRGPGPGSHSRASLCLIAEEGRALGRGTLRAAVQIG